MHDDKRKEAQAAEFVSKIRQTTKLDMDLKPFATLMNNEEDLRRAFLAIEDAIYRSIAVDIQRAVHIQIGQRGVTKAEVKHRFKICEAWIRRARGDMQMSIDKTLDLMHHALRCELDGSKFDPATLQTRIWSPT